MKSTNALVALFFLISLPAFSQGQTAKQYNCRWEAIRTIDDPQFRPWSAGGDPGLVSVTANTLTYSGNFFKRDAANPTTTRPNNMVWHRYVPAVTNETNKGDLIVLAYLAEGTTQILLVSAILNTQLAGACHERH